MTFSKGWSCDRPVTGGKRVVAGTNLRAGSEGILECWAGPGPGKGWRHCVSAVNKIRKGTVTGCSGYPNKSDQALECGGTRGKGKSGQRGKIYPKVDFLGKLDSWEGSIK